MRCSTPRFFPLDKWGIFSKLHRVNRPRNGNAQSEKEVTIISAIRIQG